jgi:hypothetical protein
MMAGFLFARRVISEEFVVLNIADKFVLRLDSVRGQGTLSRLRFFLFGFLFLLVNWLFSTFCQLFLLFSSVTLIFIVILPVLEV